MAGQELQSFHTTLLFNFNVAPGAIVSQSQHIRFFEEKSSFEIFGFTYAFRYLPPLLAYNPIIGVGISLRDIPENIWNSTFEIEHHQMLHFDSYDLQMNKTPTDQVWLQDDFIKILPADDPDVFIWCDNSMNITSTFNKTLRFHLTVFYQTEKTTRF